MKAANVGSNKVEKPVKFIVVTTVAINFTVFI